MTTARINPVRAEQLKGINQMEKFSHPDEQVQTMYVDREAGPTRINVTDFDPAVDKVHPASHFVPEGLTAPEPEKTNKAPTKAELAAAAKADEAAKAAADAKATPAQAFTVPDGNGKFYRTDAAGNRLIAEPFDTVELAAAAVIPA